MYSHVFVEQPKVMKSIAVTGTAWYAEIRWFRCVPDCVHGTSSMGADLSIYNPETRERVILIRGADVVEDDIQSFRTAELAITLSNESVASLHQEAVVPGVRIVWIFVPVDDPTYRRGHIDWAVKGNFVSREAHYYYCSSVFRMVPEPFRDREDERIAHFVFRQYGMHYCLQ